MDKNISQLNHLCELIHITDTRSVRVNLILVE